MLQKVQKTLFFVTSPKLKILIKNVLLYRKRTKKSPFKHIRFGRSKSPVKGLIEKIIKKNFNNFLMKKITKIATTIRVFKI
jgi:hypothetical protein